MLHKSSLIRARVLRGEGSQVIFPVITPRIYMKGKRRELIGVERYSMDGNLYIYQGILSTDVKIILKIQQKVNLIIYISMTFYFKI